jgi:hypothetical protein
MKTQKGCFVDSLITCKSAAAWLDSGKDVSEFQLSRDSLQEESKRLHDGTLNIIHHAAKM